MFLPQILLKRLLFGVGNVDVTPDRG